MSIFGFCLYINSERYISDMVPGYNGDDGQADEDSNLFY